MKFRIVWIAALALIAILLFSIYAVQQEPVTAETETLPALAQQPANEDYLKSTLEEAQYLLNSEDPRVWRRAMMPE